MKTKIASLVIFALVGAVVLFGVSQKEVPDALATGVEQSYYDEFVGHDMTRDELPFFLRDFNQFNAEDDPLERVKELYEWLDTTESRHEGGASRVVLWGEGSVVREWIMPRAVSEGVPPQEGKHVTVIYTEYSIHDGEAVIDYASGRVYLAEESPAFPKVYAGWVSGYISADEYKQKRVELSWEEFNKIDVFLKDSFIRALDWLWYGDGETEGLRVLQEHLVGVAQESLDVSSLFEPVPWGDEQFTLADVLGLPWWGYDELMPEKLYYGPIQSWGWLTSGSAMPLKDGTKPERRMGLCEEALGYDWILGVPQVTRHEIMHSFQSFPLAWWYDCELWNEMYTNCVEVDEISFLSHSYLTRIRKIALRYWGFDAAAALDSIKKTDIGGVLEIDADQYYKVADMVHRISGEMKVASREIYREFYSDPLFYISLGDVFRDSSLAVDLIYAQLYEPTCLGDAGMSPVEAAEETKRWQVANQAAINKVGESVLKELKKEPDNRYEELLEFDSINALSVWSGLPFDLQEAIIEAYEGGGMDAVTDLLLGGGLR
jgi:hypothetical protein